MMSKEARRAIALRSIRDNLEQISLAMEAIRDNVDEGNPSPNRLRSDPYCPTLAGHGYVAGGHSSSMNEKTGPSLTCNMESRKTPFVQLAS